MVKNRKITMVVLALAVLMLAAGTVNAQRAYHLEHEWAKIWINQDGSIDLFYNISITLDSGDAINFVLVGQPKGSFTIGEAVDQYGHTLTTSDASSGGDYKVRVNLFQPLPAGQSIRFTLVTTVPDMIYKDTETNVGMEFKPTYWQDATVRDLRLSIVLPKGVNETNVHTSVDWNGTAVEPDGNFSVFWQRMNLQKGQEYTFGVSFPKQYIQYVPKPSGLVAFFTQYGPGLLLLGVSILAVVGVVVAVRKKAYLMPTVSMETLGIRRGLTAVEASYLLDTKPTQIVTEILYSLLQKRAVWVESTSPSIKLKIMPTFQDKKGSAEEHLRYYEIDFLNAVQEGGNLSEEKLAGTVMFLRDTVEEKLRGYCRRDTVDYYSKIVDKAWLQVEQAGTPELASKTYDEQLLWLFLDPNYRQRTETAFHDKLFEPNPLWLWYWYGYQHYHPNPTYVTNVDVPAQAAKPPTIPGADFANNVATAVENTSNNIVSNIEKFANAILPMPASKSSSEPARRNADCVCACAACACVCACVSCACACAGGGVG